VPNHHLVKKEESRPKMVGFLKSKNHRVQGTHKNYFAISPHKKSGAGQKLTIS